MCQPRTNKIRDHTTNLLQDPKRLAHEDTPIETRRNRAGQCGCSRNTLSSLRDDTSECLGPIRLMVLAIAVGTRGDVSSCYHPIKPADAGTPDVTTIVTMGALNVSRGSNGGKPLQNTHPRRAPSLPTLGLGAATATFKRTARPRCDVTSLAARRKWRGGGEADRQQKRWDRRLR